MSAKWTDADFAIALEMMANGEGPAAFMQRLGRTKKSVHSRCERLELRPVTPVYIRRKDQTPEYREMIAERRRARDRVRNKRLKATKRAERIAASPLKAVSKTDPVTRRRLHPPIGEMTKNELRAMLAQAVRNTAEMAL